MNVVLIMTDRHNPEFSGCYGHPIARTSHIDSIAETGTRFDSAYCVSPLCVPSRAAMITGRYVHETGTWDNAFPYTGVPHGWGHFFAEQGVHLSAIGKLDFQPGADCGIAEEHLTKHRNSLDVHCLFREEGIQRRYHHLHRLRDAGPSESAEPYGHDRQVAEAAERWIGEGRPADRPWVLLVNFGKPHPTWQPPRDLWEHYDPLVGLEDLDERYTEDISRLHPFHLAFTRYTCSDLIQPEELRRGLVGYHATCEFADGNVGRVLNALDRAGLREETLVVYASDHGGSLGAHVNGGMGTMYEDSIRVPLIFSGPGIRSGALESTPVSHLDLYPTLCEAVGLEPPEHMRGDSLLGLLRGETDAPAPDFVLSEYHGPGIPGSMFALRSGRHKYIECAGERPMLFDLQADPHEMHDLVLEQPDAPDVGSTIRRLRRMLCDICSPEAVDARAKADQRALRRQLTESGQILGEMWRRGYERNPERLIPRPEFIP